MSSGGCAAVPSKNSKSPHQVWIDKHASSDKTFSQAQEGPTSMPRVHLPRARLTQQENRLTRLVPQARCLVARVGELSCHFQPPAPAHHICYLTTRFSETSKTEAEPIKFK